jgi:hypothetical protein
MMFLQLAIVVQTYYWPIYFQSVKGNTAKESGIYTLPFVISSTLSTLTVGWVISKVGYYVPFMWAGAPILAIGGGLYQLISLDSPTAEWIGYQIVSGVGYGICTQIPLLSVQVTLCKEDVPTGCVVVLFFQALGGALGTSIAQNLFTDKLLKKLQEVSGIDGAAIVAAGAKDFRQVTPPELLDQVVDAFGTGLKDVFWLAVASAIVAILISTVMEWGRVPKDNEESAVDGASA